MSDIWLSVEGAKQGAKPKGRGAPPLPSRQPMKADHKIKRKPSTDQKKVRRQLARSASKTAAYLPTGETTSTPCDVCSKPVNFERYQTEHGPFTTLVCIDPGAGSDHIGVYCAEHYTGNPDPLFATGGSDHGSASKTASELSHGEERSLREVDISELRPGDRVFRPDMLTMYQTSTGGEVAFLMPHIFGVWWEILESDGAGYIKARAEDGSIQEGTKPGSTFLRQTASKTGGYDPWYAGYDAEEAGATQKYPKAEPDATDPDYNGYVRDRADWNEGYQSAQNGERREAMNDASGVTDEEVLMEPTQQSDVVVAARNNLRWGARHAELLAQAEAQRPMRRQAWAIEDVREILDSRSAGTIDGVLMDMMSASALTQVYDALNEENQAKLLGMSIDRAGQVAWKLVRGASHHSSAKVIAADWMRALFDAVDEAKGAIASGQYQTSGELVKAIGKFWPGEGDELAGALSRAGWTVDYREGFYNWTAKAPGGGSIEYVEGDIFDLANPSGRATAAKHQALSEHWHREGELKDGPLWLLQATFFLPGSTDYAWVMPASGGSGWEVKNSAGSRVAGGVADTEDDAKSRAEEVLVWRATDPRQSSKTASIGWTKADWQDGYWYATPASFGASRQSANIFQREEGRFELTILNNDGGEYDSDTIASQSFHPTLESAKAAAEQWKNSRTGSRKTSVSTEQLRDAHRFLRQFNVGDKVNVNIDGKVHEMTVSEHLQLQDFAIAPGVGYERVGSWENAKLKVTFGPGRYSTQIGPHQQAAKSGMPYIVEGTTASRHEADYDNFTDALDEARSKGGGTIVQDPSEEWLFEGDGVPVATVSPDGSWETIDSDRTVDPYAVAASKTAGAFDYDDFYHDYSRFGDEPSNQRDTRPYSMDFVCSECGTERHASFTDPGTMIYCQGCGKRLTGADIKTSSKAASVEPVDIDGNPSTDGLPTDETWVENEGNFQIDAMIVNAIQGGRK